MANLNFYDTDAVKAFVLNILIENAELKSDLDYEKKCSNDWFDRYKKADQQVKDLEAKVATLYEITDKYLKVLDNLEIDEETGEILNAEELDKLSGAFEEKSEAVACYIKNSEVFIGDLKTEEANLAKRRKQTEKRIDYLKNVLTACLDAAGRDKVETTKVRVSFRKSVAVSIDDEKALPADFVAETVTTKPDKAAIKKAIQSGQEVSGASLVENRNLQIK